MKNSIFLFFVSLSLVMGMTACSKDSDSESKGKYTADQFRGQWCAMGGSVALLLDMGNSSFTGEVYMDLENTPVLFDQLSGTWVYYPANDMIQMDILHSSSLQQESSSYKVMKVNSRILQLREQSTGAEDVYYRLVEKKTIQQGTSYTIDYSSVGNFSPTVCVSSNPNIATVNAQGHVTAKSQGVAFISLNAGDETVVAMVKVTGIVEQYSTEVMSNIDYIIKQHGTPDVTGQSGRNQAILYKQPSFHPAVSAVQYQYDERTREVSRILTVYNNQSGYSNDASFVIANYLDLGTNQYGLKSDYMDNDFFISPFTSDGSYYISYNNLKYYLREGHF